ncbi:MAG: amidohydrolase family protein [Acidobacteria bacterium]|nr:amidohydrolase family protein [Acidobacteriota bacterium]
MVKRITGLLLIAVAFDWTAGRTAGQAPAQELLVVEGGTLIDGNGGLPVRDVQIVIRGNRIAAIGRKGTAAPQGARVVQGDGKFIIPGLWDSQLNFYSHSGEAMLNHGVTSFVGIGNNGEAGVFMHDGVSKGRILAPRPWDAPVHFQEFANLNGLESPYFNLKVLNTSEEAREWTRKVLALGADGVFFQNGRAKDEVVRTAFEEGHKAGKPGFIRATGPEVFPRRAADLGADAIPLSIGVSEEVASESMPPVADPNLQRRVVKPGEIPPFIVPPPDDLDLWAYMDDAKAAAETTYLVARNVRLIPAFIEKGMGLQKGWSRFETEDRKLFANEAVQFYYPEERRLNLLGNYANPPHTRPQVRERRERGFRNALRFHRMYVEAGGKVLVGTDGGNQATPGPAVHHEMEILVEDAGLTPMQVLQAATKWPAEVMRVAKEIGTVEAGKLADLVILNSDPLENVSNVKNIASVIFNGRVLDGRYHYGYNEMNPFRGDGFIGLPPVEDLAFTLIKKRAVYREGLVGRVAAARLAQPGIETIDTQRQEFFDPSVSKVAVREGGPTLRLKVTGYNFFERTQVFFDDRPMPFDLKSISEMEIVIDETYLRRPGRYRIQLKNPPPPPNPVWGDGRSNIAWLLVAYRDSLLKPWTGTQ